MYEWLIWINIVRNILHHEKKCREWLYFNLVFAIVGQRFTYLAQRIGSSPFKVIFYKQPKSSSTFQWTHKPFRHHTHGFRIVSRDIFSWKNYFNRSSNSTYNSIMFKLFIQHTKKKPLWLSVVIWNVWNDTAKRNVIVLSCKIPKNICIEPKIVCRRLTTGFVGHWILV